MRSRQTRSGIRRYRATYIIACALLQWVVVSWALPVQAGREERPAETAAPEAGPGTGKRLPREELERLFFQANQSYRQGDYETATRLYEAIVSSGHVNGAIFYNLANCYVRSNRLGKAIVNYNRALLLSPRDEDCKANLRYARDRTVDKIEGTGETPLWHQLAFWYEGLNYRELVACFLVCHASFWFAALLRLFYDREWLAWVRALSLVLAVALGLSAALKYHETRSSRRGVIIAEEASVRSGFGERDTVLFILHEGTELEVIDRETSWCKIRLPDGRKGWLKKEHVETVALPL